MSDAPAYAPGLAIDRDTGRLPAASEAVLRDLLSSIMGAAFDLAGYRIVKTRDDYVVLVAQGEKANARVVVKLAGPSCTFPCPFERTASLHRLVGKATAVPLAEVLAVSSSYERWPWRYMVQSLVPGEDWASIRLSLRAEDLKDAYRQIGEAAAELHSVRFEGFGELAPDGTIESDATYLAALEQRARRRIADPRNLELFVGVLQARCALFTGLWGPSLCHEDLNPYNILFRRVEGGCRLVAILDLDSAWAGHHESDLARLELWRGMTGEGFWDGYGGRGKLSPGYDERRPVHQLMWCLEYASTSRQHLEDTHRVCAELGIAPLERFESGEQGQEGR